MSKAITFEGVNVPATGRILDRMKAAPNRVVAYSPGPNPRIVTTDRRAAMQSIETWLPVPGYDGIYEVSDQGRVRSLSRTVVYPNGMLKPIAGRIMSPSVNRYGYLHTSLFKGGKGKTVTVHKLVALTFLPERASDELQICHGDGDKRHNWASNLRWDTAKANAQDALTHGANYMANKTHCPTGHAYTGDNLIVTKSGNRQCKTCKRDWMRANNRKAS